MTFDREMQFLDNLHADLLATFGDDLATALFGAAAAEFFAGPEGVTRMFERHATSGKTIAHKTMPK